jgi:hypothetical protein
MPRTRLLPIPAVLVLVLLGCDPERATVGRWEVVTIDGVGPRAAAPARVLFPAGAYGTDTLAADFMWHEYTVDSLVLTLEPGGSFSERLVERERALVHKNTYERPDYVSPAFGGDLIREDRPPAVEEATGAWTLQGDSLVLTQPREEAVSALAARVHAALPSAPAGAVREAVDLGVAAELGPRWTGMVKGDRLELRAGDGRVLTFRRTPADP